MVYHLGLTKESLSGVRVALLPGDPFRVPKIAEEVMSTFGGSCSELAWKREFRTILVSGKVIVTSTGIGGPSTAIVMEELSMLGIDTFIRIGTTGAIREDIKPGSIVITSGSVRMDGASTHYAPPEYPALAHHELLSALIESAREHSLKFHVGITASTDTFYPGQERTDSFTGQLLRRFQGSTEELRRLNVLNYEMESATLLTLGSVFGLRCGVVSGVVVNRCHSSEIDKESLSQSENNAIKAGVGALKTLL